MSASSTENTNKEQNTGSNQEKDFVSKNAYEEVSRDMHKYKASVKEMQAKVAEYETRLKREEEAKLIEQQRYEELYRKEQEQRQQLESKLKQNREQLVKSVKMTALQRELGDIKPKYLAHADLDAIVVHEDGTLSSESVMAVANKFREENPELVPSKANSNLTDFSAGNINTTTNEKPDFDKMSSDEKREYLAKLPKINKFKRE
jgi:hypothetical protein